MCSLLALLVCYNRNGTVWSTYLVGCCIISDVSWIVICSWYLASQKLAYGHFFCAKLLQGLLTSCISVHAWTGQNLEMCTDRVNIIRLCEHLKEHPQLCSVCDLADSNWRREVKTCHFGSAKWFWPSIFAEFVEAVKRRSKAVHPAREECDNYDLHVAPRLWMANHND